MDQPAQPGVVPFQPLQWKIPMDRVPTPAAQLTRALWQRGKPQGRLGEREEALLCPITTELLHRPVPPGQLAAFRVACGHSEGHAVPTAFLHTLFQPLLVELILCRRFPVRAMGLIHLRQVLAAHRPIAPDATLDLSCTLTEVRRTPRGVDLDCLMKAREGDELVWHGKSTLLSRDPKAPRPAERPPTLPPEPASRGWTDPLLTEVPARMGRRYAAASGDYNPIHLHPWLARVFGFPKAIAHGMWTLGWALAQVSDELPPAHEVTATFRKPVLLPGSVALRQRPVEAGLDLEVRHPDQDQLHLAAEVRW